MRFVALLGGVVGALLFTLVYTLIEGALIKPLELREDHAGGRAAHAGRLVAIGMAAVLLTAVTLLPTERVAKPQ